MLTYIMPIRPEEVIRLLKAEIAVADGQPELYYRIWEDYLIEEDYNRKSLSITEGEGYSWVSTDVVLNIQPRAEQNYWALKVIVHRDIGPRKINDAAALIVEKVNVAQFAAMLADRANVVTVRLDVLNPFARDHFNTWLEDLRARHRDEDFGVRGWAAAMAPTVHTSNKGLPLFEKRALWTKRIDDRIIAWNKRSSARVQRRIDRVVELAGRVLAHVAGRN